jgi:hypothetical protein
MKGRRGLDGAQNHSRFHRLVALGTVAIEGSEIFIENLENRTKTQANQLSIRLALDKVKGTMLALQPDA